MAAKKKPGLSDDVGVELNPSPAPTPTAAAKKPARQLVPWQPQLQASADEYMHRMLRLIRQPGLHPAYMVANAAGLCALMACPAVQVPHDETVGKDGPVRTPWDRRAIYEEAALVCPGALPWSSTEAGKAAPSE